MYECPQCDYKSYTKGNMTVHEKTHNPVKEFQCKYCGKMLKRENMWKLHLAKHEGKLPFKCSKCEKAYTTLRMLEKHKETHSASRQQFECSKCSKIFLHKHSLEFHMDSHENLQRWQCRHCGQGFNHKKVRVCICVQKVMASDLLQWPMWRFSIVIYFTSWKLKSKCFQIIIGQFHGQKFDGNNCHLNVL